MASNEPSPGGQPAAEPAPPPAPELDAAAALVPDLGALRPEDFAVVGVPTVIRGYERRRVEWLLLRASEAYAYVVRQRDAARDRIRSLEADAAAADGEARVSAASVAELTQRLASAEEATRRAVEAREKAEQRLLAVEAENDRTVSHADPDTEAASILVAAVRTAEELRQSSRARALATLTRARQRAAALAEEVDREERALGEARNRRAEAERVARELLDQARAEAERVAGERREAERLAAEIGDERRRVQALLAGALSALEPAGGRAAGMLADLSSRLPEAEARGDAGVPRSGTEHAD